MLENPVELFRKFTSSLSFKLSFYAGFLMFFVLVAFAFHNIDSQQRNLTRKIIQVAIKDSEVIEAAIWNGMMANDRVLIQAIVNAVGQRGGFESIDIYDAKGRLRYSSRAHWDAGGPPAGDDVVLRGLRGGVNPWHKISEDGRWLNVVNPLVNSTSCSAAACHAHPESEKILGALTLRMSLDEIRAESLDNARKTVTFAFFLFLFLSTAIGLAVIYLVNPSVKKLQDKAASLARGEYVPPETAAAGRDEIAELSRAFDQMSRQVHERTTFLAERRKMYRSLFEQVPCYLTVVSSDYRIVRSNNAFREQFGDQVGKHCFVGYKGFDSKCIECPVEKTFAGGQSHQSEEIWQLDGRRSYVLVHTAPIYDDDGNVSEVLEMSLDITALKELQVELERQKEEFKYLFEKVPCYLTVIDNDFNIVQANRFFTEDFGESTGRKCYAAYKDRASKCENCPVEKTFADGLSHESEEVWRRDGKQTDIVVRTAPLRDETREIVAVMEMSTNVTEVKRLQGELALLGETIAGMSHTIKNILSGLQGGVYIVDSGLERGKEERVRQGWAMVKRNVERISALVRGILYASKTREPELVESSPADILNDVCDLYENRAKADGIALIREFGVDMSPCLIDPEGIHSAVANLVSNAVEACRSGHKKSSAVTVSAGLDNGALTIRVSDNGVGMPEEVQEKLFGRFYSTRGSRGTGLGLVMTRKIIHEHGGSIEVDSEVGRGTTFVITIPFRAAEHDGAMKKAV